MLYQRLIKHAAEKGAIKVALVGAGSMGVGIAYQIAKTPGMELVFVGDRQQSQIDKAVLASGKTAKVVAATTNFDDTILHTSCDAQFLTAGLLGMDFDVLVEATNSIGFAGQLCVDCIKHQKHVVLMNAEVDLALGHVLHPLADANGVIVSSDAGDQHGVLARMIDEIRLMGFDLVMAGNIKGFLKRDATPESLVHEAAIRRLNPVQCCAYTDGTKLMIEMALIANSTGMLPLQTGMMGPKIDRVEDVFNAFDLANIPSHGTVDYILGSQPGGGVFVVARCDEDLQRQYLEYYKMGHGPFYLFYRPYHLCHLETPAAIATIMLDQTSLLRCDAHRCTDVYAYAKRDLSVGETIEEAIGGSQLYGMIQATTDDNIPIALLETEPEIDRASFVVQKPIKQGQPLVWSDLNAPSTRLLGLARD